MSSSLSAWAAGPILVDTLVTGSAVVWQDGDVIYNPETTSQGQGGSLGVLDNDDARDLVKKLFEDWEDTTLFNGTAEVSTVSLTVTEGEGLGSVDTSNLDDHFTYCPPTEFCPNSDPPFVTGSARDGESPILFDGDGSMTDMILGSGANNSILGFAGPRVVVRDGADLFITESQAVLNGKFLDCPAGASATHPCQDPEVPVDAYRAVIFHELGHFLGLDHTQVNLNSLNAALGGDEDAAEEVATMSPLFIGEPQLSPHYDDKVAISSLYPTAAFLSDFCTIAGTVFQSDGETPLQGVNVIARREDDPLHEATSFVSGALFTGNSDCTEPDGDYQIRGVLPGVEYTLEIEAVAFSFQGGSSIEPCDPPLTGFEAETAPGTFSCDNGGQNITTGSSATTDFVTSKEQEPSSTEEESASNDSGAKASSSGCTLLSRMESSQAPGFLTLFKVDRAGPFLLLGILLFLLRGLNRAARCRQRM